MSNEGCCVNAIVSRSDPCCAQRGAMWFDLNTETLKIMDDGWIVITGGDVKTVNGKNGDVVLTPQDILGSGSGYYTESGWRLPAQTVLSGSDSLITSGAVYSYLTQIMDDFQEIEQLVEQGLDGVVKWDTDIVTAMGSVSTDLQIPTAKTVYNFVNSMDIQGDSPINVTTTSERNYNIGVSRATHDPVNGYGVCRLANILDYNSSDGEAALTSDVIKPIIDDIIDDVNSVTDQANENLHDIREAQADINDLKDTCIDLQRQIDELRALIPNP